MAAGRGRGRRHGRDLGPAGGHGGRPGAGGRGRGGRGRRGGRAGPGRRVRHRPGGAGRPGRGRPGGGRDRRPLPRGRAGAPARPAHRRGPLDQRPADHPAVRGRPPRPPGPPLRPPSPGSGRAGPGRGVEPGRPAARRGHGRRAAGAPVLHRQVGGRRGVRRGGGLGAGRPGRAGRAAGGGGGGAAGGVPGDRALDGRMPSEAEVRTVTRHWGAAAGVAQQLLLHWLSTEAPGRGPPRPAATRSRSATRPGRSSARG